MGAFGKSIFSMPPVIGGVQLRAFSAFHAQALLELDSPFLERDRNPTNGEIIAALVVCSCKRDDGLWPVVMATSTPAKRAKWNWRLRGKRAARMCSELDAHIIESMEEPRLWKTENTSGKRTGADWPFYVVSVMAQNFPAMNYADLWDMPLAELVCHKAILAENNDQVEIAERDLKAMAKRKAVA